MHIMSSKLDILLDVFLSLGIPGLDCMVMKDGEVIYRRTSGFSDGDRTIPVNGKELYNLYSCSKPVTCSAALQLWEQGKFKLDDPLSDYMPEFKNMAVKTADGVRPAKNPILIKHLFTMTSGFDYGIGWPVAEYMRKTTEGRCPTREVMRELAKCPLLFDPGERWEYGLSHDILAALVEVISGERFGQYVRKNIFEPLGMENSTFLLPKEKLDLVCEQYDYDDAVKLYRPTGPEVQAYKFGSMYESGGAGMVSTVEDYMKFLEAMRVGDVILKKETIDLMTTNMLTEKQAETFWQKDVYYYGLGVRCPVEGKSFDFGWGGAAGSFLLVDRKHNITAFYAQHVLHSPTGNLRTRIAPTIIEQFAGEVPTHGITLDEEVLKKYL